MQELSDLVVIAGRNGVGKSRLLDVLHHRLIGSDKHPHCSIAVSATTDQERATWQTASLIIETGIHRERYLQQFNHRWKPGEHTSTIVVYKSNRTIGSIKDLQYNWNVENPLDVPLEARNSTQDMKNRFQNVVHTMFLTLKHQEQEISRRAIELQQRGEGSMALDFSDPIQDYKKLLAELLPGKRLTGVDARHFKMWFDSGDGTDQFEFHSLSSGEQEIVKIAFDYWKFNPRDCIVLIDELEAHLHPEFVVRLINVLRSIGKRNQFVIATHSPELISMALEQGSLYVIQPPKQDGSNQAQLVKRGDPDADDILGVLGRSMGVISLGRRVVLVEGKPGGIDERVYRAVAEKHFPGEFVFVPMGGRAGLESFEHLNENALKRQLFGVDFFEILDGDELAEATNDDAQKRLRRLPRCHVENYFLDASIWVELCHAVVAKGHEALTEDHVEDRMREIAMEVLPEACALQFRQKIHTAICSNTKIPVTVGDAQSLPTDMANGAQTTLKSLSNLLDPTKVEQEVTRYRNGLEKLIQSGGVAWKKQYPAKLLVSKLNESLGTGMAWSRVQTKYLQIAEDRDYAPFDEIKDILSDFRTLTPE